jgi:arginine:pyruvate transaminase
MRYSSRTARLGGDGGAAWDTHDRAVERADRGEEIFLLSIGDPDFDTPAPIREAAVRALATGRTHYAPGAGEPKLRAAIAAAAAPSFGGPVDPERVTVFPGAQAALFAAAQCLLEPGDEVITSDPAYVTYEGVIGAAGATMRSVPLRPERRFHLDPDELGSAITPSTRALLLNFPHNPTGAVLTQAEAAGVAELCHRHDLILISDEVYASLCHAGGSSAPASLPGMADRTVVISSLSKSHAMTGWRCGWSIAPPGLAAHLERLTRCMFFGVAQFVQDAAVAALESAGSDAAALRAEYIRRAQVVVGGLAGAPGLLARPPEAGMYVFADIRGTGLSGWQFAEGLLAETGVAVTPGEGFGPSGAGHVRITLGTGVERLAAACARIAAYCHAVAGDRAPVASR